MIRRDKFRICAFLITMMMAVSAVYTFAEGEADVSQGEAAVVQEAEPAPQEVVPVVAEPAPEPVVEEAPAMVQEAPQEASPVEAPVVETAPVEVPAAEETVPAAQVEETSESVTTTEPAAEEPEPQPETEEETSQPVQEAEPAATTETTAPTSESESNEAEEPVPFTGNAEIKPEKEYESLYFEKETTLKAVVKSANKEYTIRWETRTIERPYDDPEWTKITKDKKFEFRKEVQQVGDKTFAVDQFLTVKLDEDDVKREFRLVLTDVETNEETESAAYRFPAITEDPEKAEEIEESEELEVVEESGTPEDPTNETEISESAEAVDETEEPEGSDGTEEAEASDDQDEEGNLLSDTDEILEAPSEQETAEEDASDRRIELSAEWEKGTPTFETSVTFSATLYGYEGITYKIQWQHSTDGVNWEDVPGATDATYTVVAAEENFQDFWRAAVTVE